ncbi:MAG: DNA-binding protein [Thermosphaera sp.]
MKQWLSTKLSRGENMRIMPFKLSEGDIIPDALIEKIKEEGLRNGFVTGIGGLASAEIGFYNPLSKEYEIIRLEGSDREILEVGSIQGNYMVKPNGEVSLHLHLVLGAKKSAYTGHLIRGIVKPLLEVFLVEVDSDLSKVFTHRWSTV